MIRDRGSQRRSPAPKRGAAYWVCEVPVTCRSCRAQDRSTPERYLTIGRAVGLQLPEISLRSTSPGLNGQLPRPSG